MPQDDTTDPGDARTPAPVLKKWVRSRLHQAILVFFEATPGKDSRKTELKGLEPRYSAPVMAAGLSSPPTTTSPSAVEIYIASLLKEPREIGIVEFIKGVNAHSEKLDLSFMEELHEMGQREGCSIPHHLLVKYGVLTEKDAIAGMRKLVAEYKFVEGEDFLLLRDEESPTYLLHRHAFKRLLIRAEHTMVYIDYYLLQEECTVRYSDYQKELRNRYQVAMTTRFEEEIKQKEDERVSLMNKISAMEANGVQ